MWEKIGAEGAAAEEGGAGRPRLPEERALPEPHHGPRGEAQGEPRRRGRVAPRQGALGPERGPTGPAFESL